MALYAGDTDNACAIAVFANPLKAINNARQDHLAMRRGLQSRHRFADPTLPVDTSAANGSPHGADHYQLGTGHTTVAPAFR